MKQIPIVLLLLLSFIACDRDTDPCANITCLNEGTCNDGTCDCPEGFIGNSCETPIKRLKRIVHEGVIENTFEYNDKGDISAIIGDQISYTFEYLTDTILRHYINHISGLGGYSEYTALDDNRVKLQSFDEGVPRSEYQIFSELTPNCGYATRTIFSVGTDNEISSGTKIFIDDFCSHNFELRSSETNNLIIRTEVINDENSYHLTAAINPLLGDIFYGNAVEYTEFSGQGINLFNSYTSEFIYANDTYPIHEIREHFNGWLNVYYEYY